MPAPFQRLSVDQFASVLKSFPFRRRITGVHMHHTWRPNHAMWKGHDSMVGMWRFHTQDRGFSDIAQHLTIDPEGFVWTGRNWNAPPASAIGHNGTAVAGPFMFETVGDFDIGRNELRGEQRDAVLKVIALVQGRFGLAPESLLFHNQVAAKSCPGTGIVYADFVAELRVHAAARSASDPAPRGREPLQWPDSAFADSALVQRTLRLIEPDTAASRQAAAGTPMEELNYDHVAEAAMLGMPRSGTRGGGAEADAPTAEQIDALRPYVLNLRMGQFSESGLMTSSEADVAMIVDEHLRPAAKAAADAKGGRKLRIVLYAHGGLVKESRGLATAQAHIGWWRDNGVYPIHFVWETGLFETIRGLLERAQPAPRQRGLGDLITDRFSDPLVELTVRALQAERIWGAMKLSAQLACTGGGGAHSLLKALAAFIKDGAQIELHAVGHSAGSIFQAHLVHAAHELGLPSFASMQLMAPAVRVDTFLRLTEPLIGRGKGVDALTLYTMRRDFERDDDCAGLYRKSLLYLVSGGCEPKPNAPILGLEDSLRADPTLRALFALGSGRSASAAEVIWSTSPLTDGSSATRAVHHGDFDNDASTMNSILRRVLGLEDTATLDKPFPSAATRGGVDAWRDGVDWPPELAAAHAAPAMAAATPTAYSPFGTSVAPGTSATRRRIALCIGIDNYPSDPLSGCRNDAQLWQKTLQGLGFEARTLLDPKRDELFGAIEQLFATARAGDEVVLQYAGHGTQVDDLDGDEAGGDTPGKDEALCPLDFADGALLIDDDLGALIDRLACGARLTLFMDCCHSGSNTRVGGPRSSGPAPNARARFVKATPELRRRHREWREKQRSRSGTGARTAHPELLFTACRSDQVAWESDGHGEFTLRATGLLGSNGGRLSARALHQNVMSAFGPSPRQQPLLDGPADRLDSLLFGG